MSSKVIANAQIVTLIKEVQQQMETGFIDVRNEFKSEIRSSEARLTQTIDGVEVKLTQKIDGVEVKLTQKIDGVEVKLTQKIDSVEVGLTQRIDGVEARLTQKIDGVEAKFDRIHLSQIHDNGLLIANLKHQNRRITLLEKAPRLT